MRGAEAESQVVQALESQGWTTLARNWRGAGGELDAVVQRQGCLRFVEVKLRDLDDPRSEQAVGPDKRARLRRAARLWLEERGEPDEEVCFFVVLVGHDGTIEWIDDAFDG